MTGCDAVVAVVCREALGGGGDAETAVRTAMLLDLCEALEGIGPLQVHVARADDRGPVRALAGGARVRHTPGGLPGSVLRAARRNGHRVALVPAGAALVTAEDVGRALALRGDAVVAGAPDGALALLVARAAAAPALAGTGAAADADDVADALAAAGLRVTRTTMAWPGRDVRAAIRALADRPGPTPAPRTRALLHLLGAPA